MPANPPDPLLRLLGRACAVIIVVILMAALVLIAWGGLVRLAEWAAP